MPYAVLTLDLGIFFCFPQEETTLVMNHNSTQQSVTVLYIAKREPHKSSKIETKEEKWIQEEIDQQ